MVLTYNISYIIKFIYLSEGWKINSFQESFILLVTVSFT